MILRITEAVADAAALVSQAEQMVKRFRRLRFLMTVSRGKRNILQPTHHLIGADRNGMKAVQGLE